MHHTNTVRRFIIAGGRRHFMPEKNPIHFTSDRGSRETWGICLDDGRKFGKATQKRLA